MDNSSNFPRNRPNDHHLGVNKMGKSIRKSPLHQPSFPNSSAVVAKQPPQQQQQQQQPQPQVYNISKNDFRNIVQQLTGSPSQDRPPAAPPPPGPPHNPPKHPSLRLQRIRPPPLSPIARPPIHLQTGPGPGPGPAPASAPFNAAAVNPNQASTFFGRPPGQFSPAFSPLLPPGGVGAGDSMWSYTGESPISAYMRYLQNSIMEPGQARPAGPSPHPVSQQQNPYSSGILPMPPPPQSPTFPSPRGTGPPSLLPSPTTQFGLPSPSSFLNLLSPRSPYPLLSPGFQYPPPLTPNFAFSSLMQSPGILGPGPQPPPSPGLMFPPSPSGFLPMLSPRWRE